MLEVYSLIERQIMTLTEKQNDNEIVQKNIQITRRLRRELNAKYKESAEIKENGTIESFNSWLVRQLTKLANA